MAGEGGAARAVGGAGERRVDVCINETLERERGAARLVEDRVERIAEEQIEVEVAAAVVEDGDIPEEVDALDGRVHQRLVQWQPAGLSLL